MGAKGLNHGEGVGQLQAMASKLGRSDHRRLPAEEQRGAQRVRARLLGHGPRQGLGRAPQIAARGAAVALQMPQQHRHRQRLALAQSASLGRETSDGKGLEEWEEAQKNECNAMPLTSSPF